MEDATWTEEDWSTLLYTIQRQDCILLLGPDAAAAEIDGFYRPLTEILANELADKLRSDLKQSIDLNNLAQVSQYYQMEAGRNALEAKVHAFYEQRRHLSSELHQNLAILPFYFTITSTPDQMFSESLRLADKTPGIEHYNFQGKKNPELVQMGTIDKPLIFHLYGSLDDPESLVLTEEDLLDFLVAVIRKEPPLPNNILSESRDTHKSLLFLGFGFRHWYLRILLRVLEGREKKSLSFAFEQYIAQNIEEFQKTILFFKTSNYKIQICKQDLQGFVKELKDRYTPVEPSTTIQERRFAPVPKVFLCHAKANREKAIYVRDRLKEAGLDAWFDEDDLHGGDEWNATIESVVQKKIDYFVALQSQVMNEKYESYFHKEINLALDRQDTFKRGIRFIIPVKIEDCQDLEELAHLQSIDISQRQNIEDLIDTIEKDQERRKKG